MRRALHSLSILVVTASVARADFAHSISSTPEYRIAARPVGWVFDSSRAEPRTVAFPGEWMAGPSDTDSLWPVTASTDLAVAAYRMTDERPAYCPGCVIQRPPPPRADSLGLTGLLSVGAVQLVRRAWYGGFAGLRRSCYSRIAFLETHEIRPLADLDALPDRVFEYPSGQIGAQRLNRYARQEPVFCRETQSILDTIAPRQPPHAASFNI